MAIDPNKLKAKLQKVKRGNSGGNDYIWKPQEGSQVIRIVPYPEEPDWPFQDLRLYYKNFGGIIISPTSFGEADPIQEFVDKLYQAGDEISKKEARNIQAKSRTFVPVIVRGEEEKGPRWWGFGKTAYEELLSTINDPDYGDITDLKEGRDITVEYEIPKGEYPKTTLRVKPNVSKVTDSKEVAAKLKDVPPIKEIYSYYDYNELKKRLENYFENKQDTDDQVDLSGGSDKLESEADIKAQVESAFEIPNSDSDSSNDTVSVTIDDELDDLFND